MSSQDLEAKIVVLGAQNVGKTSLLTRFIHNTFLPPSAQPPTVGANFLTKRLVSSDTGISSFSPEFPTAPTPTTVRLQIWDTAGQERFRSLGKLYYRGAHAAILCYDVTDQRSFEEMGTWLRELREYNSTVDAVGGGEGCIVHVVGTKADIVLEDPGRRQVPFEKCIAYVAEQLHGYSSGSAVLGVSASALTTGSDKATSIRSNTSSSNTTRRSSISPTSTLAAYQNPNAHTNPTTSTTTTTTTTPSTTTTSKRSSGFWSLNLDTTTAIAGTKPPTTASSTTSTSSEPSTTNTCTTAANQIWNSCHEISAKDGEGVEEVFRVIVRKLVEQKQAREARHQATLALMGRGNGGRGGGRYGSASSAEQEFYDKLNDAFGAGGNVGSFRLTKADKRRSWLGGFMEGGRGSVGIASAGAGTDDMTAGQGTRGGRCC